MDSTARLAAKLALVEGRVHPMAWVEVFESHTPYEWRMQQARAIVDPFGDDRADMRAEANTLAAINPCEESIRRLSKYTGDETEETCGPAAMRALAEFGV